jgi:pilus assembly protein CpaD
MSPSTLPSPRSTAVLAAVAALISASPLAGCATPEPDSTGTIAVDGYRERHPIVVEQGEETLDLPVGADVGHLTPRMLAVIESFGREAAARRATGITIQVPSGSVNEVAARSAAAEATRALIRAGFPSHAIGRRAYPALGPEDAAPIRLSYPKIVARVPHPCGEWPDQVMGTYTGFQNGSYHNFGCATQANLAAMVVDPSDLVAPAEIGAADTTREVRVIDKYRKGEKTKSTFDLSATKTSSSGGE